MPIKICPECGAENGGDAKFCLNCGHELEILPEELEFSSKEQKYGRGKFCPACGTENRVDAKFCSACNSKLKFSTRESTQGFWDSIDWVAVIAGLSVLFVFAIMIYGFAPNLEPSDAQLLLFIPLLLISGFITGYIADKEYRNGVVNGFLLGAIPSLIVGGLSMDIIAIVGLLIITIPLCIVGGLLGVFLRKHKGE
jgi:ribosomal protein L40E